MRKIKIILLCLITVFLLQPTYTSAQTSVAVTEALNKARDFAPKDWKQRQGLNTNMYIDGYCVLSNTTKVGCIQMKADKSEGGNQLYTGLAEEKKSELAISRTCQNFNGKTLYSIKNEYLWGGYPVVGSVITSNFVADEQINFDKPVGYYTNIADCQNSASTMISQLVSKQNAVRPTFFAPILEIFIPGLNLNTVNAPTNGTSQYSLPWLGQYVSAIYKFAIAVASILAVILIIVQGIKIVVSGGGEGKVQAYKNIGRIVIGLVIAWGSYSILYIVNPNLLTLTNLQIDYIGPIQADQEVGEKGLDNGEDLVAKPTIFTGCITKTEAKDIQNFGLDNITVANGIWGGVSPALEAPLKDVDLMISQYNKNNPRQQLQLVVTNAARTLEQQNKIYTDELKTWMNKSEDILRTEIKKQGKTWPDSNNKADAAVLITNRYVAKPTCNAPHAQGVAIDILPIGMKIDRGHGCLGVNDGGYATVVEMWKFFQEAGWKRYCPEWWHFEYGSDRATLKSECTPDCKL